MKEAPFGQLPLLMCDGYVLGQSIAIVNSVARRGHLLGESDKELDLGQMLIQEYNDIYDALGRAKSTGNWVDAIELQLPKQAAYLERLLLHNGTFTGRFLVGEACIFAALHLALDVAPKMLDQTPNLRRFYEATKTLPQLQAALAHYASCRQYFVPPQSSK